MAKIQMPEIAQNQKGVKVPTRYITEYSAAVAQRKAVRGERLRLCSQFYKKLGNALEALSVGDITKARGSLASLRFEVYDVMEADAEPLSAKKYRSKRP